jgi:hypothetical protein
MSIEIRQHTPGQDVNDFIRAPFEVFKDDPVWVPPLNMIVKEQLSPVKNPLFQHADVALFTAWKNGRLAGRVSAQVDRNHLNHYNDNTGFFGFFDTINDEEVARRLIESAGSWVSKRGMKRLRGPLSFTINDEVGTLIDGFDTPPMFMMAHSTPYQGQLAEAAGLQKAKDIYAWIFNIAEPKQRAVRAWEEINEMPEVRVRTADRSRLDDEIRTLLEVYHEAWSENWGFVPTTEAEGKKATDDMKFVLNQEFCFFYEIDGEPAGMCLALPNLNEVIKDLNGKLFPFGFAKLLWRLKVRHPKTARLVMLGIKKKYRNKKKYGGLAFALCVEICKRGVKNGYDAAELSWTLEDNSPVNLTIRAMGGRKYKTYRIYEKSLEG